MAITATWQFILLRTEPCQPLNHHWEQWMESNHHVWLHNQTSWTKIENGDIGGNRTHIEQVLQTSPFSSIGYDAKMWGVFGPPIPAACHGIWLLAQAGPCCPGKDATTPTIRVQVSLAKVGGPERTRTSTVL